MKILRRAKLFLAAGLLGVAAHAQSVPNPWQDPRLTNWSKEINNGEYDRALAEVQQDLVSASPHPFSLDIWCRLHLRRHDLTETTAAVTDPKLREALGVAPKIYQLESDGKRQELIAFAKTLKPEQIRGAFTYRVLLANAPELVTFDLGMRAIKTQPPLFLNVWLTTNAMDADLAYQKRVEAELTADPAFAATPAGRMLGSYLRDFKNVAHRTANCSGRYAADDNFLVKLGDDWLKEYPGDASAIAWKIFYQANVGADQATLEQESAASLDAYPFIHLWAGVGPTLETDFGTPQGDAAGKQLSLRYANLREADPVLAEATAVSNISLAMRIGPPCGPPPRLETARKWVDEALATTPPDAKKARSLLVSELAELDRADKTNPEARQAALAQARKFMALAGSRSPGLLLIETLLETEDPKNLAEAQTIYSNSLASHADHDDAFYATANKLFTACQDREANWKRALAERPRSPEDLLGLAQAQEACGEPEAALRTMNAAYDTTLPSASGLGLAQTLIAEVQGLGALEGERAALMRAGGNNFTDFVQPPVQSILASETLGSPPSLRLVPQTPPSPPLSVMALSKDGALAATADARGVLGIWSIDQRTCPPTGPGSCVHLLRNIYAHVGRVDSLQFSDDGQYLVSAGKDDGTAKTWRVTSGELLWGLASADRSTLKVAVRPATAGHPAGVALLARRRLSEHGSNYGWAQINVCGFDSAATCKSVVWYANSGLLLESAPSLTWSAEGDKLAARIGETDTLLLDWSSQKLLARLATPSGASFSPSLDAYIANIGQTLQLQSVRPDTKAVTVASVHGTVLQTELLSGNRLRYVIADPTTLGDGASEKPGATPMIRLFEGSTSASSPPALLASVPAAEFPVPQAGRLTANDRFTLLSAAIGTGGDQRSPPLAVVYLQKEQPEKPAVQMFPRAGRLVPNDVAFTPDNRELILSRGNIGAGAIDLWDLSRNGQPIALHSAPVVGPSSAVTAEGFVTCATLPSGEAAVRHYDLTGIEITAPTHELCQPRTPVLTLAGSPGLAWFNGVDQLAIQPHGQPIWHTGSLAGGEVVKAVAANSGFALAATEHDLYRVRKGEKPVEMCTQACPSDETAFTRLALSADGRYAVASIGALDPHTVPPPSSDYGVLVVDLQTSALRRQQVGAEVQHTAVTSVAFVPGTSQYAFGTADGRVLLADAVEPGAHPLLTQDSAIAGLNFSPDGRYLAVALDSGSVLLSHFSVQSAQPLARLDTFANGNWSVVTPQGQYDAAGGGQLQDLLWVFGNTTVQLDQMVQEYYRSRLLPRLMGFETAELRPSRPLDKFQPQLPPSVTQLHVDAQKAELSFTTATPIQDLSEVRVYLNGAQIDPAGLHASGNVVTAQLAGNRTFTAGEVNQVTVEVANHEKTIHSRAVQADFPAPGKDTAAPPQFYAIIAGISTYAGGLHPLPLADADAREMALDIARGATHLLGSPDRVHLYLLTTDQAEGRKTQKLLQDSRLGTAEWMAPSNANFLQAFRQLKAVGLKKDDIFLLFLAGHGMLVGKQYVYPTREFDTAKAGNAASYLSAAVLTSSLHDISAKHTVLLFDTCNSGGMLTGMSASDAAPAAAIDAEKEQLTSIQDDLKTYLLMGAGANEKAYDNDDLGHGFLTAGLLLSMRESLHGRDLFASDWLEGAAKKTQTIAASYGYEQNPQELKAGGALAVANLPLAELDCIPSFNLAPRIVRPTLKHDHHRDTALEAAVVDALVAREAAGTVPARYEKETSDVAHIAAEGHYEIDPTGALHLSLTLAYGEGDEQPAPPIDMTVDATMTAAQQKDLANQIVDQLYRFAAQTALAQHNKLKPTPAVCQAPLASGMQ